jgi:DNA-binding MarR family transcriptional regulator
VSLAQLEHIEANLHRTRERLPGLPATEVLILRATLILGRDLSALLEQQLKPAGLTEPEFRLLMALFSHGGRAFAGDLCAAQAQSPANLTRIADVLVMRGYISREPDADDRRRMWLVLEPAGEQQLRTLLPRILPDVVAAFEDFSAAQKQQLLDGLKRLLAGIDARAPREAAARDEYT